MPTYEEATLVVTYTCENCGKKRKYEKFRYRPKEGDKTRSETPLSGMNDSLDSLLEKAHIPVEKDLGSEKCPKCGYIQSWMLADAKDQRNGRTAIYVGGVTFVLALIFILVVSGGSVAVGTFIFPLMVAAAITFLTGGLIMRFVPYYPNKQFKPVKKIGEPKISWIFPEKKD